MSDLRTGARSKGDPLRYSDIGFQSSNKVGVSNDGNHGTTWSSPVGAKDGQNPKGAVPNLTGTRGGSVPSSLSTQQNGLRTGGGHSDGFVRRANS